MHVRQSVLSLAQAEKVKSGMIWAAHVAGMTTLYEGAEKRAVASVLEALLRFVLQEIQLAERLDTAPHWSDAYSATEKALVMVRSGVADEASHHLTRGLGAVTTLAGRAMQLLQEQHII
jgi:hypothetical protein